MAKKKGISLKISHPELAKEWDEEVNGPLTLEVLTFSGKEVGWKCSKCGHRFMQIIAKRTARGQGCPVCSGRIASPLNNLLLANPKLCEEWDREANGDKTPEKFLPNSKEVVNWKCRNNSEHRWPESILARNRYKKGCPTCTIETQRKKSLLFQYPELAKEWDIQKNGELTYDISYGSHKIVGWICKEEHKWDATIYSRVKGNGCKYCGNKAVNLSNCLSTRFPKIAREWHPIKNGTVTACDVLPGSGKLRWWLCPIGHDYEETPNKRTSAGENCPYCSGRRVSDKNRLSLLRPDIAEMWHKEKNGSLTPDQVSVHSDKKAWFICKQGHVFETCIKTIVKSKRGGCKYCYGREASPEWNLLKIFPDIATQLHPTLNTVSPEKLSPYSNKKVIWQCSLGHNYTMRVCNKTSGGQCTKCFPKQSMEELKIFCELAYIFPDVDKHKIGKYQLDIYIPFLKLGIEYDGEYYHRQRALQDLNKNKVFLEKGIEIIRLRELPLQKLQRQDLIVPHNADTKAIVNRVLLAITKRYELSFRTMKNIQSYLPQDCLQNESEYRKRLRVYNLPGRGESLLDKHPELAREFDISKNGILSPEKVFAHAGYKVNWICPKCGHSYSATPDHRSRGTGCPYCKLRGKRKPELNLPMKIS